MFVDMLHQIRKGSEFKAETINLKRKSIDKSIKSILLKIYYNRKHYTLKYVYTIK